MTIIVDNYAVNYQIDGEGPVIVLLHGWGDTLKTFDALTAVLKKKYTIVRLDIIGFGASDAPKETFSLEKYANFIHDFLEKIGEKHIYAIIGHSNGGAIAIQGLATGLLRAEKLVLLASSGVRSIYKGRRKALRFAAKAAKIPTKLLPRTTQKKLKRRAYSAIGSDMFIAEGLQDTFKVIVGEDVLHESAMLTQPTLLLYGVNDTATPIALGELFAKQIERSKLVGVPGAGHFLHHDNPDVIKDEIEGFLND